MHTNYTPVKVVECIKSTLVRGIIVKLQFWKTQHLTIWQIIWPFARTKYIYFWLPYKNVVNASDKYNIVGPKSRDPYAMSWFEVGKTSTIYNQGLNNFVFRADKTKGRCLWIPFPGQDLHLLTRKKVIKILDQFVFAKQNHNEQTTKRVKAQQ